MKIIGILVFILLIMFNYKHHQELRNQTSLMCVGIIRLFLHELLICKRVTSNFFFLLKWSISFAGGGVSGPEEAAAAHPDEGGSDLSGVRRLRHELQLRCA